MRNPILAVLLVATMALATYALVCRDGEPSGVRLAAATGTAIPDFDDPGWRRFAEGQHEEAERIWLDAADEARREGDDPKLGAMLCNLAHASEQRNDLEQAIDRVKQCTELLDGEDSKRFIAFERLARLQEKAGHSQEAERELLALVDASEGNRGRQVMALLHLARHYTRQGSESEAERVHLEAVRLLEGESPPPVALDLHLGGLTNLYQEQGRIQEAADLCVQRVNIFADLYSKLVESADTVSDCARILETAGRADEASELRALAVRLRAHANHRDNE